MLAELPERLLLTLGLSSLFWSPLLHYVYCVETDFLGLFTVGVFFVLEFSTLAAWAVIPISVFTFIACFCRWFFFRQAVHLTFLLNIPTCLYNGIIIPSDIRRGDYISRNADPAQFSQFHLTQFSPIWLSNTVLSSVQDIPHGHLTPNEHTDCRDTQVSMLSRCVHSVLLTADPERSCWPTLGPHFEVPFFYV